MSAAEEGTVGTDVEASGARAKYRWAGFLQLVHGGLMELGPAIALVPLLLLGVEQESIGEHFSFALPFLQENLYLMMAMSGVFGVIRVIGAVALLRNRLWGFALSLINGVTTIVLMIFLLPAGIVDGLLAGGALILMLSAYFGNRPLPAEGLRGVD